MTINDLIIPVLAGASVVAIGGAALMLRAVRRQPLKERLSGSVSDRSQYKPKQSKTPGLVNVVSDLGQKVSSGKTSATLRQTLTQAGYHDNAAAAVYIGAKIILLSIGLLAATLLLVPANLQTHVKLLLGFSGSSLLFFIPNIVISSRRSRRRQEIRTHLPDAIDLLEICVSAGMGLDMAWNSVADEVSSVCTTLADEMALTNLEIHLGADRAGAMRHMAQRTSAEELSSLVAVFVQSERFGTSLTDVLRTFSESMREGRSQLAQECAEKMAVKLIFPMVGFIFPAVVMVMAGPAFLTLYRILAKD